MSSPAAATRSLAWASIDGERSIPISLLAGLPRHRNRNRSVADGELDNRSVGLAASPA